MLSARLVAGRLRCHQGAARASSRWVHAKLGTATAAIHADGHSDHTFSTQHDISPPLSLSTTYDSSGHHVYSRITNPSRDRAEALLGAVEGVPQQAAHAVLYSSGLAAIFGALAHLLPHRVAIARGYHGTRLVVEQLQRISCGTRCASVSLPSPEEVPNCLGEGDVIWLETPLNPTCELADIEAYSAAARHVGALVVVDSTFAPPPLQRPLTLGAHMVMHSTTKYLAGHSDAIGGALCVRNAEVAAALRDDRAALGSTPGSLEVWLLMRSLRSLHVRVQHQSRSATHLAGWLYAAVPGQDGAEQHPLAGMVHAVHHPSLPGPLHDLAARQMPGGFGGCFALELSSPAMAKALPGALSFFKDATSLGGVESLIEWRRKYDDAISPQLLRVSVGLEESEQLQADLEQAIVGVHTSELL